ncbi:MAG: Crp/Fnr family transcriptional regulator [Bacteroidia bacterium]|nr:Crp/Fnr family transcriptional regulator [Bacteroidia bacterium]
MIQVLRQHLTDRLGSQTEHLDTVLAYFEPMETRRNAFLLQTGDVCRHVYFVVRGCVQVFSVNAAGDEITRDIVFEGAWVSQLESFGQQLPATESLRTPEPSQLLAISYPHFGQMMQTVPQFAEIYRQILLLSFNNAVYRVNTLMGMDAADRVRWLLDHQPNILTRLSSRLVASYLGITPETLTRLKSKI